MRGAVTDPADLVLGRQARCAQIAHDVGKEIGVLLGHHAAGRDDDGSIGRRGIGMRRIVVHRIRDEHRANPERARLRSLVRAHHAITAVRCANLFSVARIA